MNMHSKIPARVVRVSIVDDERPNGDLLETILPPEGYQLVTASSAEQAPAVMARQQPGSMLLDLVLPGVGG